MYDYEFGDDKKKEEKKDSGNLITHVWDLSDDELHTVSLRIRKIIILLLILLLFTWIILFARRFNTCLEDIESIQNNITSMEESITEIQYTIDNINESLDNMHETIDDMDQRLSRLENLHGIDSTSE